MTGKPGPFQRQKSFRACRSKLSSAEESCKNELSWPLCSKFESMRAFVCLGILCPNLSSLKTMPEHLALSHQICSACFRVPRACSKYNFESMQGHSRRPACSDHLTSSHDMYIVCTVRCAFTIAGACMLMLYTYSLYVQHVLLYHMVY